MPAGTEALLAWLAEPARWQGPDSIPVRLGEHALVSAGALVLATLVALPTGLFLGHRGRGGFVVIGVANVGRALPALALLSFGLTVALAFDLGLGFWPTLMAMVPLGIPPILTSSHAAMRQVDRSVVDAARGMGLGPGRIIWSVELPLAAPAVVSGIRAAAVAIVATATLGALVAGGGLGRYILDGLALREYPRIVVGAGLVAAMAVAVEMAADRFERLLTRRRGRPRPVRFSSSGRRPS